MKTKKDEQKWSVIRRLFTAKKYPVGSKARKELNERVTTSEYMTSYKYLVVNEPESIRRTFRTKKEAMSFVNGKVSL